MSSDLRVSKAVKSAAFLGLQSCELCHVRKSGNSRRLLGAFLLLFRLTASWRGIAGLTAHVRLLVFEEFFFPTVPCLIWIRQVGHGCREEEEMGKCQRRIVVGDISAAACLTTVFIAFARKDCWSAYSNLTLMGTLLCFFLITMWGCAKRNNKQG